MLIPFFHKKIAEKIEKEGKKQIRNSLSILELYDDSSYGGHFHSDGEGEEWNDIIS